MSMTIQGHCLCGHVAYRYSGEAGPASYCHCEDCRRCTGSAFNVGVRLERARFEIVRGSTRGFTKRGASGNALTRHFCPECGSPIYTSSETHPEHVYVKAGTLDDPRVVEPTSEIWTVSAVPWHRPATGLEQFARGRE